MCSTCGSGRPIPPWEDALGAGRSHRALRARALTAAAATSALRLTADPTSRAYRVHRATAPQQTAYDLAQCCAFLPRSVSTPALDDIVDDAAAPPPLDCPLDVWAVVLQLHSKVAGPHLVRVGDAGSAIEVHLHGAAITSTGPLATREGPYLHVTGPHSAALRQSLHRLAAVLCSRLYLAFPESA